MKVATVSIAGERRLGRITADRMSIGSFDFALAEARDGILALIRRNGIGVLENAVVERPS
jgi:hypothetical protein